MRDKVKNALRIKSNAFDLEIDDIISAAIKDLMVAGIFFEAVEPFDVLINRAIILYSKANFGSDTDSEKYQKAYSELKKVLCLAGEYSELD